jgi:DNA-binding response OmpR family regulator
VRGDEVLRSLRRDPRTAGIPVVVISADATPRTIHRLRTQGADAYLTKPLDVDEFLTTIDRLLPGFSSGRSRRGAPAGTLRHVPKKKGCCVPDHRVRVRIAQHGVQCTDVLAYVSRGLGSYHGLVMGQEPDRGWWAIGWHAQI